MDDLYDGLRPELSQVVDSIGFGWAQFSQLIVGGGIWMCDAAAVMLISIVTHSISSDWALTGEQRSFASSVLLIGMLSGTSVAGPISDRFGRRMPLLGAFTFVLAFSVLSAGAPDLATLLLCQFLAGVGIGVGQPTWNALGAEISPSNMRGAMQGMTMSLFSVGELLAIFIAARDDANFLNLHWRNLFLVYASLTGIQLFLAVFFLRESPCFLALGGDKDGATRILESMQKDNRCHEVDIRYSPPAQIVSESFSHRNWYDPFYIVLYERLGVTFCIASCLFSVNFLFYGSLYALPRLLPDLQMTVSPIASLVISAVSEVPGVFLGSVLYGRYPPKKGLLICLAAMLLAQIPLFFCVRAAAALPKGATPPLIVDSLLHLSILDFKLFTSACWVVGAACATEVYPTSARTTGSSIVLLAGRLGSVLSSVAYEVQEQWTGRAELIFPLFGLLVLLTTMAVAALIPDIKRTGSEEFLEERACLLNSIPANERRQQQL